jgi:spore germination cell wall hydrolase CwlJ-like protein
MADLREISDQELLTAYLWAEARGEPEDGQQTVCSVMLNRVKEKRLLVSET